MQLKEYNTRIEKLNLLIDSQQRSLNYVMYARIVTFLGLIGIIAVAIYFRNFELLYFCLIPLFLFGFLLKKHSKEKETLTFLECKLLVHEQEIRAINGDYSDFESGEEFKNTEHSYTHDLDVFGEKSLFQFLNRTTSKSSNSLFSKSLSNFEVDVTFITNKQEAVKELSQELDWRINLRAKGIQNKSKKTTSENIVDWNEEEIQLFKNNKTKNSILIGVPVFILSALALTILSFIPVTVFALLLAIPLGIVSRKLRIINTQHKKSSQYTDQLIQFNQLSQFIENKKFETELLNEIKAKLFSNKKTASLEILELAKITQQLDNRSNPVFAIFMNALFLWDLQFIAKLKTWLIKNSSEIKEWFLAVNQMEMYCSLANFSFNNPEYTFPTLSDSKVLFAKQLAHPLILKKNRIASDFEIKNLQEFTIITGANMAGKSTFLRAIGSNLILAMMGAPVCSSHFIFTPLPLYSSMRTTDSLSDNESYFYSELKRLQSIVNSLKNGNKHFVILDEILKGTNSKDKAEGSKKFVKQLIKYNNAGIIATHDLSLCEIKNEFPKHIENHYFDVEIINDQLVFDYKLKPGICSNMNTEFLMKKMGITE